MFVKGNIHEHWHFKNVRALAFLSPIVNRYHEIGGVGRQVASLSDYHGSWIVRRYKDGERPSEIQMV